MLETFFVYIFLEVAFYTILVFISLIFYEIMLCNIYTHTHRGTTWLNAGVALK